MRTPSEFALPHTEGAQRVGFLAVLPGLLERLGTEPGGVLEAAGLTAHALRDPENTVPYAAMGRLVAIAAERAQCPHLGLLIAEGMGTASLGVVGELMRNAPTLGVALRDFAIHQHRNAHGSVAYLLTEEDSALFGYAVYEPGVDGHSQICDTAALIGLNMVRELARPTTAQDMELLLFRPEPQDLEPYHRLLGVNVRFNAEQTAVRLPRSWLNRPVTGANAAQRRILEQRVAALQLAGELDMVTRLRRALRVGLLNGHISADEMGSQLGMNRRTLHRRLRASGVHFQQILNQTRFEFAQQLLANTRLSIAQVGLLVRYTEPAVFTRAFLRWTGVTPSQWRTGRVIDLSMAAHT